MYRIVQKFDGGNIDKWLVILQTFISVSPLNLTINSSKFCECFICQNFSSAKFCATEVMHKACHHASTVKVSHFEWIIMYRSDSRKVMPN